MIKEVGYDVLKWGRRAAHQDPAWPQDRDAGVLRRGLAALVGLLMLAIATLLSYAPALVERFYVQGLGQYLGRALGWVSGRVPFSLVELVLAAFILWFARPAVVAAWHIAKRRRRLANAVVCAVARTAAVAGVVVTSFYLLWGLNYSRAGLLTRMGWARIQSAPTDTPWDASSAEELARLCSELVDITNFSYVEATGATDLGYPSIPSMSIRQIDNEIDRAFVQVTRQLGLQPALAGSHGPAKPIAASRIMSTLGIAGFYFPYTGEANYNREAPYSQQPMTIAHEKAHQRGITGENEANFLGFLACVNSEDAYTRYSGYLFAQRQLLTELLLIDRQRGQMLLQRRLPGVQRDVNWIRAFWDGYEGPSRTVSLALNNVYLKANHVEGGLRSYHMSAQLLVLFARHNGGTCLVPRHHRRQSAGRQT